MREEINERTERIKEEMLGTKNGDYQPSKINFKRKVKSAPSTSLLQLGIAAILGLMVVGWLQFGSDFFYYLLWIMVPGYLLFRARTLRKRK